MKQLALWHQTKPGLAVFGAIELLVTYGFASLAIDRGSWWWYALALIFLVGGLQNFLKLVRGLVRHDKGR